MLTWSGSISDMGLARFSALPIIGKRKMTISTVNKPSSGSVLPHMLVAGFIFGQSPKHLANISHMQNVSLSLFYTEKV